MTTSILRYVEDDINLLFFFENLIRLQILRNWKNGRRPQVKGNFNITGRQPQFKHKWKKT
jgi:hypothetical protein